MIGILFQNSLAANELMMSFTMVMLLTPSNSSSFVYDYKFLNFTHRLDFQLLILLQKAFSINLLHFIRSDSYKEYGFESLSSYFIPKSPEYFYKISVEKD